jgi:hypothetical protein
MVFVCWLSAGPVCPEYNMEVYWNYKPQNIAYGANTIQDRTDS